MECSASVKVGIYQKWGPQDRFGLRQPHSDFEVAANVTGFQRWLALASG